MSTPRELEGVEVFRGLFVAVALGGAFGVVVALAALAVFR